MASSNNRKNKNRHGSPQNQNELSKRNNELGNENQKLKSELKAKEAEISGLKTAVSQLEESQSSKPVAVVDDISESFSKMMDGLVNLQNNQTLNKMDEAKHLVDMRKEALDHQLEYLAKEQELYCKRPDVINAMEDRRHKRFLSTLMAIFGVVLVLIGVIVFVLQGFSWLGSILLVVGFLPLILGFVPFIDASDADKFEKIVKTFNIVLDKFGLPKKMSLPDTKSNDKEC